MRIEVYNGDVHRALRKLKKKMFDDGTIKLLMERRYYEKPSEKRRRKKLDAMNRQQKQVEREKESHLKPSQRRRPKKIKKKSFGMRA